MYKRQALPHAVAQALFHRGDEILRYAAAYGFIREYHLLRLLLGLKADIYIAKLAVTTGRLLMTAMDLYLFLNSLPVSNLGYLKRYLKYVGYLYKIRLYLYYYPSNNHLK